LNQATARNLEMNNLIEPQGDVPLDVEKREAGVAD
jgi:hypothetical protein